MAKKPELENAQERVSEARQALLQLQTQEPPKRNADKPSMKRLIMELAPEIIALQRANWPTKAILQKLEEYGIKVRANTLGQYMRDYAEAKKEAEKRGKMHTETRAPAAAPTAAAPREAEPAPAAERPAAKSKASENGAAVKIEAPKPSQRQVSDDA